MKKISENKILYLRGPKCPFSPLGTEVLLEQNCYLLVTLGWCAEVEYGVLITP